MQPFERVGPAVEDVAVHAVERRVHLQRVADLEAQPLEIVVSESQVPVVAGVRGGEVTDRLRVVGRVAAEVEAGRAAVPGEVDDVGLLDPLVGVAATGVGLEVVLPGERVTPVELAGCSVVEAQLVVEPPASSCSWVSWLRLL